ncbi:MAG: DinB family protein [Phycisphaerae bacterium]
MSRKVFETFFSYGDWANAEICRLARGLAESALDQPFDMGLGTLRKTIKHILDGETVWLERWQGRAETPWPSYDERPAIPEMTEGFAETARRRAAFLATQGDADLARRVTYRDSKGSLFSATLSEMISQMFVHSTHHRAQACNMLRRVGAPPLELDFMVRVRQPA